tara:strand:+ start:111653 stop:111934 length:282 start_codon:yes stop_codon:yes gene_type:complete
MIQDDETLSLQEFALACRAEEQLIEEMVEHALLEPLGQEPNEWQFSTVELERVSKALRIHHDLAVNWEGVALALELLDEVQNLRDYVQVLERH